MILRLLLLSLPFISSSSISTLSHPNVISLPLTRRTYDRAPVHHHDHEIHTMAIGNVLPTTGCAINNFWTPVQIGVTQFYLTVDTISATTAVADTTCINCQGVNPLYIAGPTATKQATAPIQQIYSNGRSWNGITYNDQVSLPGQNLPVVNMGFGAIQSHNNFFPNARCDGLNLTANNNQGTLGLAPPTALLTGTQPLFDILRARTQMDAIITIQMCTIGGRLWLGGYDNNYLVGLPSYTPLLGTNAYQVAITDMSLGGISTNLPTTAFGDVVIDTTSTNMVFPSIVYNTITQSLLNNPDFVATFGATFFSDNICIKPKSATQIDVLNTLLPNLKINMGSQVNLDMVPISSYVREFITLQSNAGITSAVKLYCPGISLSPTQRTLLGWSFLNQFTTIIDRQNTRVGFARTSNCGGFTGADAVFIPPSSSTTETSSSGGISGTLIGIIVGSVVGVTLFALLIVYGRRWWSGRKFKKGLSTLNYSTRGNAKVQFADPTLGSKGVGFMTNGIISSSVPSTTVTPTPSVARGAAYSVEEDGQWNDSPLANSPIGSASTTQMDNFSSPPPSNQGVSAPPRKYPRAMIPQRVTQQQSSQPSWTTQTTQPQSQSQSSWTTQTTQPQSQSQSSWNQRVAPRTPNDVAPRTPGDLPRSPANLATTSAPPRKAYTKPQSEWIQQYDNDAGAVYYLNTRTNESTWDRPPNFA